MVCAARGVTRTRRRSCRRRRSVARARIPPKRAVFRAGRAARELALQLLSREKASGRGPSSLPRPRHDCLQNCGKPCCPVRRAAFFARDAAQGKIRAHQIGVVAEQSCHQGPFESVDWQPGFHIEFETAVRVHVLPDQRRQGAEIPGGEFFGHCGRASTCCSMRVLMYTMQFCSKWSASMLIS